MDTSYSMDTYRAHDLNISMRTSSGDTIEMDFSNQQSSSLAYQSSEKGSSTSMSFSSMQSFSFKLESNGISKQDQKEIDAFMKTAQPFIDDFLKELKEDAPKSPVTKLAREIADIFEPSRQRDENHKNHTKSSIVNMFDDSMKKLHHAEKTDKEDSKDNKHVKTQTLDMEKVMDKIFKDAQKLLEKTLKEFDQLNKSFYA
ncbi:MAG: hypothetical protein H8E76_03130 [Helicobacteraceae bacterium]|nr:hypothetical protein [Candidatus Sulfurimonas ponti]MBL6973009.1 hypothetical protein [Sulfurimonas sp.]